MSKIYMVYVSGNKKPTKIHATYDLAVEEAERLACIPAVKGRKVYVLVDDFYFMAGENPLVQKKTLALKKN